MSLQSNFEYYKRIVGIADPSSAYFPDALKSKDDMALVWAFFNANLSRKSAVNLAKIKNKLKTVDISKVNKSATDPRDTKIAKEMLLFLLGLNFITAYEFNGWVCSIVNEKKLQNWNPADCNEIAYTYTQALRYLDEVIHELNNNKDNELNLKLFKKWFGIKDDVSNDMSKIIEMLKKVRGGANDIYRRAVSDDDLLYDLTYETPNKTLRPLEGVNALVYSEERWNVIYLGQHFWEMDEYFKMQTFIHEWSHKSCQTIDDDAVGYGVKNCLHAAASKSRSQLTLNHADSLAFFAMDVMFKKYGIPPLEHHHRRGRRKIGKLLHMGRS